VYRFFLFTLWSMALPLGIPLGDAAKAYDFMQYPEQRTPIDGILQPDQL
jgi:hypothetical protein